MVRKQGGSRARSRHKFGKSVRQKGKISIRRALQTFTDGDKVLLKVEPAVQSGLYHRRYHGRVGTVDGRQGTCYYVIIKDIDAKKRLLLHPIHLRKVA